MNETHPSDHIKPKYLEQIREGASKAEKDGKLTRPQLSIIYEQQWFKTLMPTAFGGGQMNLPEALQLFEALAWADGSVGWEVALCACAGWYGGITKDALKDALAANKVCFATTGPADKGNNNVVSGIWNYVAGANEATTFIIEQGKSVAVLLKDEVNTFPSVGLMGLVAATGVGFEAKDVAVPPDRMFTPDTSAPAVNAALYHYPFYSLLTVSIAATIAGMTIHFLDSCSEVFAGKEDTPTLSPVDDNMRDLYEKHTQKFYDARTKLYYANELAWQACVNNRHIKGAIAYKVSSSAYELARRARECVDALYPFCGIEALSKTSELNRVWRDLHTAAHHPLMVFGQPE